MLLALSLTFLLTCASSATELSFQRRNLNTISAIYNTTVYPNNQAFITNGISAVPPGLFSVNASGRISPIGNFSGYEDSVEYFFGLTPPIQAPLYDTWTSFRISSFTSGCPSIAASVVYGTTTGVNSSVPSTYNKTVTKIKQVAFWRFDDTGAVLYYDAWLPNLKLYTDLLYGSQPNNVTEAGTIQALCGETQQLCTGANQQYSSVEDCAGQLEAKSFGDWDEVWGDNVVCRSLHVLLAKLRPDAHCPHVGPTGGGKCVDVTYNDVYIDDDQALFGSGDPFICPDNYAVSG